MRNQSVHQTAGWEKRRRPLMAVPLLLILLVSGAIFSDLRLVEGGSITPSEQSERGRESAAGFTTAPQRIEWRVGGQMITGQVTLTLLEANPEDDTLRGRLDLTFLDRHSRRNRLPNQLEEALGSLKQEVRAHWQKGTFCPSLHLRIPALELPIESGPLQVPSFLIKVEETEAEVPQLLCSWTRQINAGRSRLGILRALNRLLLPPAEVSLNQKMPDPVSTRGSIFDVDLQCLNP